MKVINDAADGTAEKEAEHGVSGCSAHATHRRNASAQIRASRELSMMRNGLYFFVSVIRIRIAWCPAFEFAREFPHFTVGSKSVRVSAKC